MKWSFLIVVVLGLVAAACMAGLTAVLPSYIRGPVSNLANSQVEIVVARQALPAMRIVDGECVTTKFVPRKQAPEGCLSDTIQALGKVVASPMVEGQPFTKTSFAEGWGPKFAAALPNGMRAVGIALSEHSGLLGVLYPGARVDVILAYRGQGADESGSKIILQNIQVMSIESQTIVSPEADKTGRPESNRKRMVTLMVDPEQARILASAIELGDVSLMMRNPLDPNVVKPPVDTRPVVTPPPPPEVHEIDIIRGGKHEMKKLLDGTRPPAR